jgi:hypothetical protein
MTKVIKILSEKFKPVTFLVLTVYHAANQIKVHPKCISDRVRNKSTDNLIGIRIF